MSNDPEQLLSEALRAQAKNATAQQPSPPQADPAPPTETPVGHGLLSGAEAGSLERERAALDAAQPTPRHSSARADTSPVEKKSVWSSAHWVLVVALLLGLLTGAAIGFCTLP